MDAWEAGETSLRSPLVARRPGVSEPLDLSYLVPVRWRDGEQRAELAAYLAAIAPHCAESIVVDGSPPEVFAANAEAWGDLVDPRRRRPRRRAA